MKKLRILIAAAAVLAVSGLSADETELLRIDGENGRNLFEGGGSIHVQEAHAGGASILCRGRQRLVSLKKVRISADEQYQVSLWVKAPGPKPANIYCGWMIYDRKGKVIPSEAFHQVSGSFARLVKPVRRGDRVLVVDQDARWKKGGGFCAVFNARQDQSDLPNHSCSASVTEVRQTSQGWEISLAQPVQQDYAAGTGVREHMMGGQDFLFCCDRKIAPGGWQQIVSPRFRGRELRRGESVRVVLIVNLPDAVKDSSLLIDDLKMTVNEDNVVF